MPARRSQKVVPNGKLVRVDAICERNVLTNIRISGDFFVYPEEALFGIERELDGMELSGNEEDLVQKVGTAVSANGATLIGFGAGDIAEMLRELRC